MTFLRHEIVECKIKENDREICTGRDRSVTVKGETRVVCFLDAVYETDGVEGSKNVFSGTRHECELKLRRIRRGQLI